MLFNSQVHKQKKQPQKSFFSKKHLKKQKQAKKNSKSPACFEVQKQRFLYSSKKMEKFSANFYVFNI